MFVYRALDNTNYPLILDRRYYTDVGRFQGDKSVKVSAYNTSKIITDSLVEYSRYLNFNGVSNTILLGVDEEKLFYLDCIYIKMNVEGMDPIELNIELKNSYIYRILEDLMKSEKISFSSKYFFIYQCLWSDVLNTYLRDLGLHHLCY